MSKIKNLVMRAKDVDELNQLKDDYEAIGREVDIDVAKLELTVLALPRKSKRRSEKEARISRVKRQRSHDPSEPNYDEYAEREF